MARPRPRHVELRGPPSVAELENMSTADLIEITIRAPGLVTRPGSDIPWQATPRHGAQAEAIIRARGVWDPTR